MGAFLFESQLIKLLQFLWQFLTLSVSPLLSHGSFVWVEYLSVLIYPWWVVNYTKNSRLQISALHYCVVLFCPLPHKTRVPGFVSWALVTRRGYTTGHVTILHNEVIILWSTASQESIANVTTHKSIPPPQKKYTTHNLSCIFGIIIHSTIYVKLWQHRQVNQWLVITWRALGHVFARWRTSRQATNFATQQGVDVVGCCWMLDVAVGWNLVLLGVVGCCWLLLVVAGCCWTLLGCWMFLGVAGCC